MIIWLTHCSLVIHMANQRLVNIGTDIGAVNVWVNSWTQGDTIWPQRTWSTLVQVMAWCPKALSHYLHQSWLIINVVLWHSRNSNFTGNAEDIYWKNVFENYTYLRFHSQVFPGANMSTPHPWDCREQMELHCLSEGQWMELHLFCTHYSGSHYQTVKLHMAWNLIGRLLNIVFSDI